mmetsp:Transcript_22189/g.56995  ORF Transcript_22189/g.56995 Transcript_22189/m.56995 type:complete len:216 (-) Transcript_22189:492-1139(-)
MVRACMLAVGALVFDTSVGRCGVVAERRVGDRSSAVRVFYPSSDPPPGGEEAASQREAWKLRAVTYARDVESAGYADCAMWLLRMGRWEAREHLRIVVDSLLQNVLPATEAAVSMDLGLCSVASIGEGVGTFSQTVREFYYYMLSYIISRRVLKLAELGGGWARLGEVGRGWISGLQRVPLSAYTAAPRRTGHLACACSMAGCTSPPESSAAAPD